MSLKLSVHQEDWIPTVPFRISNAVWHSFPAIVVELQDGDLVGRGEAEGVYYFGETPEVMIAQVEEVAGQDRGRRHPRGPAGAHAARRCTPRAGCGTVGPRGQAFGQARLGAGGRAPEGDRDRLQHRPGGRTRRPGGEGRGGGRSAGAQGQARRRPAGGADRGDPCRTARRHDRDRRQPGLDSGRAQGVRAAARAPRRVDDRAAVAARRRRGARGLPARPCRCAPTRAASTAASSSRPPGATR